MSGIGRHRSGIGDSPAVTRFLLLALIVRAGYAIAAWWLTPRYPFHHPDTDGYLQPAFDLVAFGTFTSRNAPELFRTPGYPLLLQLGVWLGAPEIVTVVLQILLSVVTVAGVYVLAHELFGDERPSVLAALLYALEPLSVIYTATLVTETYFTAVLVWTAVLLVHAVRHRRTGGLLAAAALLGLSVYIRPIAFYLPMGLLAIVAIHALWQRQPRRLLPVAAGVVIVCAIVAPWMLRNRALGFPGISSVSAVNMYFYNAAALRAAHAGTSFLREQQAMGYPDLPDDSAYLAAHPDQREWGLGQRARFQGEQGRREVLADLPGYARMHLIGMGRAALDPGVFGALKTFRLYPAQGGLRDIVLTGGLARGVSHLIRTNAPAILLIALFTALLGATYVLAGAALLANRRLADPAVHLLLATAAYFVVLAGGPVGEGRFRHPVMPFLCVFAGAGLQAFLDRRRTRS